MKLRSIISYCIIVIIIVILSVATILTVNKRHSDRAIKATTSKIIETAKKCYEDEICKDTKITLKELYDNNLIELIANPKTKEYYNENSYVLIEENEIEFIEVTK